MTVTVTNTASRNQSWDRILYTSTYLIPQKSTVVDTKIYSFRKISTIVIVRILLNPIRSVKLRTFLSSLSSVRSSFNHQYVFLSLKIVVSEEERGSVRPIV